MSLFYVHTWHCETFPSLQVTHKSLCLEENFLFSLNQTCRSMTGICGTVLLIIIMPSFQSIWKQFQTIVTGERKGIIIIKKGRKQKVLGEWSEIDQ